MGKGTSPVRTLGGSGMSRCILALLVGTTLAVRSFSKMQSANPGFDPENVLTMGITLPRASYPHDAQILEFQQAALARVASLPGVESAALTLCTTSRPSGVTSPVSTEVMRSA